MTHVQTNPLIKAIKVWAPDTETQLLELDGGLYGSALGRLSRDIRFGRERGRHDQSSAQVIKRRHNPLEVMLACVRWYAACPLSLRRIEEMMQERGVSVDHATVHRWAMKILPVPAAVFRRRKRPVGTSWRMDETQSKYLNIVVEQDHRAIKRVACGPCSDSSPFAAHACSLPALSWCT
jgi:hypothetical protein